MTDNEIIKALECCKVCSSPEYCRECPYVECTTVKGCVGEMLTDALDLINRQKAEIERLKEMNEFHRKTITENAQKALEVTLDEIGKAKAEAIKEFAERLKASQIITHRSKEGFCVYEFDDELIDTLVEKYNQLWVD